MHPQLSSKYPCEPRLSRTRKVQESIPEPPRATATGRKAAHTRAARGPAGGRATRCVVSRPGRQHPERRCRVPTRHKLGRHAAGLATLAPAFAKTAAGGRALCFRRAAAVAGRAAQPSTRRSCRRLMFPKGMLYCLCNSQGMSSLVGKDLRSVATSNPTLQPDAFACWWWRRCGVTWDAVPERSWLLKLWRTPAFQCLETPSTCSRLCRP